MSGGGGSIALGIVGAVIGSFFGMTAIGWSIGTLVGGMLFPPKVPGVEGPRLGDLRVQVSQYGKVVPVVWGRFRMAGNVTWSADLAEVANTENQGKGGPKQESKTYSYYGTWMVLLTDCKNRPITGIRRIWDSITGRLIYDIGPGASIEGLVQGHDGIGGNMTVYTGTGSQLADSTMEAHLGVGNVPGYRYRSYVVFTMCNLERFSNRIPSFEFEIISGGVITKYVREATNATAISGIQRVTNPRFEEGVFSFDAILNTSFIQRRYRWDLGGNLVSVDSTQSFYFPAYGDQVDGSQGVLVGAFGVGDFVRYVAWRVRGAGEIGELEVGGVMVMGRHYSDTTIPNYAFYNLQGAAMNATQDRLFVFYKHEGVQRWRMYAEDLSILRDHVRTAISLGDAFVPSPIVGPAPLICGMSGSTGGSQGCFAVESDNIHLWHFRQETDFTQHDAVLYRIEDNGTFTLLHTFTGPTEQGPSTTGAAFGAVIADNGVAMAMTKDGKVVVWSRLERMTDGAVTLSTIVTDLATRKNFDDEITITAGDLDVTALSDDVTGYAFSTRAPSRSGLEQLAQAYYFDATESDGRVKFVKRGGDSVVTIPDDDLAAREYGSEEGGAYPITTQQEIEVPSEVTVLYPDQDNSYQVAAQTSRRVSQASGSPQVLQLPVVMDADRGKNIADVMRAESLTGRDAYTFSTSVAYAKYEPADIVTVGGRLLRVSQKNEAPNGLIQWMCAAEDSGSYIKDTPAAQWITDGQTISLAGPTTAVLLDIPLLRDSDDDGYGFYATARSYYDGWQAAVLARSTDGGASYTDVAVFTNPGVIGFATTILGEPLTTYAVFDETNSVTVFLPDGANLSSLSEANLLANPTANAMLIGAEVIRYKTVVDNLDDTYTLTGLLRGQRGSEWAVNLHVAEERAIVLDANTLVLVPGGLADLNVSRLYRATTIGAMDGSVQSFTNTGVSEEPYAPVLVEGSYNSVDTWHLVWTRRTRVGGDWRDLGNPPVSEATEAYEIDILSGTTVLRTITGLTSEFYDYLDATAITDFGASPDAFAFNVYQLSSVAGRGYAGRGHALKPGRYPSVVLESQPTAYWRMHNASGKFTDMAGVYDSTSVTGTTRAQVSLVTNSDTSVRFGGSPDRIDIGTFPQLRERWTIEAWVSAVSLAVSSITLFSRLGAWTGGDGALDFKLQDANDLKPRILYRPNASTTIQAVYPGTISAGLLYHLCAVHDGNYLRLYLNGSEVAATATAGTVIAPQVGPLYIGCGTFGGVPTKNLNGYMDEAAAYLRALTPDEIRVHYLKGIS